MPFSLPLDATRARLAAQLRNKADALTPGAKYLPDSMLEAHVALIDEYRALADLIECPMTIALADCVDILRTRAGDVRRLAAASCNPRHLHEQLCELARQCGQIAHEIERGSGLRTTDVGQEPTGQARAGVQGRENWRLAPGAPINLSRIGLEPPQSQSSRDQGGPSFPGRSASTLRTQPRCARAVRRSMV